MKRVTKKTIVSTDDDANDCLMFSEALGEIFPDDKTILAISNDGVQLMDSLNKNAIMQPNVIFLELIMPRKNGFECLNEITSNRKREEILLRNVSIIVAGKTELNSIVFQFRQLLINLISIAIKFSHPNKAPEIVIPNAVVKRIDGGIEGLQSDLLYSKITISDNGIGFDSQYKNHIFKVFQRLPIDSKFIGTGIGLTIVKNCCQPRTAHYCRK